MSNKYIALALIGVTVVVGLAILFFGGHASRSGAASTPGTSPIPTQVSGGSAPTVFSALEATESFLSDGIMYIAGVTNTTGLATKVVVGSCATTATSSVASVQNPFAATSTVSLEIFGTLQASSTNIIAGTSTLPSGYSATNLSNTLINVASMASSSIFSLWSGITVGGLGYANPGSATFRTIVVGPNEYVGIYASTTLPGFTFGIPTCTYKEKWEL